MFTDIVGYTALGQENESAALELLERHRQLLRPLFSKHAGREVKTMGDAFLVEFSSALEATLCAIDLQSTVHSRNLERGERLQVRIGIHVGDVMHQENDVLGDAVNIASRIYPLAAPGGICISQQVQDHIKNKVSYPLVKIRVGQLKNVREPIDVYKVVLPWEGTEPEAEMAPKPDRYRLAVLPLDNISPDPNDEYFADGLTDELITALSRVSGLEVIARTSVLRYKGGAKQIATIGDELGVGSILEGSVRKAGNRIRVTAQLVSASNQAHIWADTYDRQLDDVFAVQSDIAEKVAEALRLEFLSSEKTVKEPTHNLEAYTLCLKGRFAASKLSKESLMKGIEFYEKAIALAPEYASCYADLAQAWLLLGFFELSPPRDALAKAKSYAEKALGIDDSLAAGHVAMGRVLRLYDWRLADADEELKRATELEPNLAIAHAYRAQGLQALGRREDALAEARRALELDPFSVGTCQILGTVYLYDRRYDEAIEQYERALEIDPTSPFPLGNLGLAYVQKGLYEKGIPMIEKANKLEDSSGRTPSGMNDLAYAYARAGRKEDVRRLLGELLEIHKDSQRAAPAIAGVYTTLGEYDKAFEWLDKALKQHSPYLFSISQDFIFDPIRSDPRYKEFAQRTGLVVS
jgi:TolB-like protein/Flp pilus assembly protein TadD